MAGAIPIFLPTARNAFGMIGAVDWDAWDETYLRERIKSNPLVKDPNLHKAERPFRMACIQLATYDGTVYNVEKVLEKIGHLCDYVLWDEAWIGYNAFHPLYEGHSPMRLEDLGPGYAGAVLHPVRPQAGRRLLAGLADPQARQAHRGPGALRQSQAVQRVVPDPRLHFAVLSAVCFARRERQGARGQGGRDPLGSLHRARDRVPQEAARVRRAITRRPARTRRRSGSSIRSFPTSSRSRAPSSLPTSPTLPGRASRQRSSSASSSAGTSSRTAPGTATRAPPTDTRWSDPNKLDAAHPGHRPQDRRLSATSEFPRRWSPTICANSRSCRRSAI